MHTTKITISLPSSYWKKLVPLIHIFNLAIQTNPKNKEDVAADIAVESTLRSSNRALHRNRETVDIVYDINGIPVKVGWYGWNWILLMIAVRNVSGLC